VLGGWSAEGAQGGRSAPRTTAAPSWRAGSSFRLKRRRVRPPLSREHRVDARVLHRVFGEGKGAVLLHLVGGEQEGAQGHATRHSRRAPRRLVTNGGDESLRDHRCCGRSRFRCGVAFSRADCCGLFDHCRCNLDFGFTSRSVYVHLLHDHPRNGQLQSQANTRQAIDRCPRQADIAHDWKTSLEERTDHALPTIRKSNNGVTLRVRRASEIAAIL
jgi:hypothetical protein